jgi:amidohydrolase
MSSPRGLAPEGVRREILKMARWLVQLRRDLHRHPELMFQERRTARVIAQRLRACGLEVRAGVGGTGVVGLWRGRRDGPVLGIRAEMDALPIDEERGRPHGSVSPGLMHACGHDAHMAMALGAARYLSGRGADLGGAVKFIFQPAEEGGAGGLRMIREGVLEDPVVDRVLALHVLPTLPPGGFGFTEGPAQASVDDFVIRLVGRGSHAAYPQRARNPIVAACSLIPALHAMTDHSTEPAKALVVSVTRFEAGSAFNVIPERAELWGTLRALDEGVRARAREEIQRVAQQALQGHGVHAEVEIRRGYPVLRSDPRVLCSVREVARSLVGGRGVVELPPSMGAEDFAYFLERCPGAYLKLGCGKGDAGEPPMLHTPQFDLDEGILPLGVEFWVRCAEAFLGGT